MCIRDRGQLETLRNVAALALGGSLVGGLARDIAQTADAYTCLLYTSDAADERSSVDLGGRRIIKKKKHAIVVWGTYDSTIEQSNDTNIVSHEIQ